LVSSNIKKYVSYVENYRQSEGAAREQVALDIINNVCAGIAEEQKVGRNISVKEMLKYIAMARGLLQKGEYADIPGLPEH